MTRTKLEAAVHSTFQLKDAARLIKEDADKLAAWATPSWSFEEAEVAGCVARIEQNLERIKRELS